MASYRERIADRELVERLGYIGAVLIEGPKACGKTATATRHAQTVVRLDEDQAARQLLTLAPDRLFANRTPILFDEWQVEPTIWNKVRRQVDDREGKGLFVLTGSATPTDDASRHSEAGRFSVTKMRPMSLFESGHSNGEMPLSSLLGGERQTGLGAHLTFDELLKRIVIGGWPELIDADEASARRWLRDYLTNIVEVDIQKLGSRRDPSNLRRLLASLGRSVAQATKAAELARDVGGEDGPIAKETLSAYLTALDRLHLLDNAPAWLPHMRSRARLRSAPVRYFVDSSIGPAALGIGTRDLMNDLNALGLHYEALVIRDLRIYAQPLDGRVDSWRDAEGHEVDAVVSVGPNKWGAFEIKLHPEAVDEAGSSSTPLQGQRGRISAWRTLLPRRHHQHRSWRPPSRSDACHARDGLTALARQIAGAIGQAGDLVTDRTSLTIDSRDLTQEARRLVIGLATSRLELRSSVGDRRSERARTAAQHRDDPRACAVQLLATTSGRGDRRAGLQDQRSARSDPVQPGALHPPREAADDQTGVATFRADLRRATDDALSGDDDHYSEQRFLDVKRIIGRFRGREGYADSDKAWARQVTDVRNWFVFSASERIVDTNEEWEHYSDSDGKSGGQKEKLAYTILAASLAYQFGLEWGAEKSRDLRFAVIDEAFGRGSDMSTRYALELFAKLGLQLLIVTPLQKVHVIEPYVKAIGFVDNPGGTFSRLQTMTIEEYRSRRDGQAR